MTDDHSRQRLPNRRFRRLLPAAVAAVTLATSAPFVAPGASQAKTPPKVHMTAPPGKIAALTRADTTRGMKVQGNSAT